MTLQPHLQQYPITFEQLQEMLNGDRAKRERIAFSVIQHNFPADRASNGKKMPDELISSFDIWNCPPDPCHHNPGEVTCRKCILDYLKSFQRQRGEQE